MKGPMDYVEKCNLFLSKNGYDSFKTKTDKHEIPFLLSYGSSSSNPDNKNGISTSDIVLWCKFLDNDWFRPYGNFSMNQIYNMIDICRNDNQIVTLFEMLSYEKKK